MMKKMKGIVNFFMICLFLSAGTGIMKAQDSDGDGIVNTNDQDDDNDGIRDAIEDCPFLSQNSSGVWIGQTASNASVTTNSLY